MPQPKDDLSRSLAALNQDSTLIAVIEMSQASWLVGAIVPGVERHPLKKLTPDAEALLRLLWRWREEAGQAGHSVTRLAIAYEAGRDGFWLAPTGQARGLKAHGCAPATSRLMSSMLPAWRCRASTAVPRPAGWTSTCCNAPPAFAGAGFSGLAAR